VSEKNRRWKVEDGWSEEFDWFLVDEGKIWYSFATRDAAREFQQEHFMADKLLLPGSQIRDVLMSGPDDFRTWRCKSPVRVVPGTGSIVDSINAG